MLSSALQPSSPPTAKTRERRGKDAHPCHLTDATPEPQLLCHTDPSPLPVLLTLRGADQMIVDGKLGLLTNQLALTALLPDCLGGFSSRLAARPRPLG